VIALNAQGIGYASEASEYVHTVDVLAQLDRPFFQQWWFLVIVALVGLILIIIVIFILCLTGRRKYKASRRSNNLVKTIVQLNDLTNAPPTLIGDDPTGFSTYDTTHSMRLRREQCQPSYRPPPAPSLLPNPRMLSLRGTRNGTLPRTPPRPSPGSVNYNSDDDGRSMPDDSSSLSEKTSDISTAPSHGESDAEESDRGDAATIAAASPFPNNYANGNVQNSWKRTHGFSPASQYGTMAEEENSELDSSQYAYGSLSRGQIVLNNTAGSRAPLPGFSSFV